MDYQVAQNIRGRSFSSLIREKIYAGSGVGSAIGRTITGKLKATGTGIIEKIDPLNIAKFVTGGSKLAPAILGRLTGRSTRDIKYFAGDNQAKRRYTPIQNYGGGSELGGSSIDILDQILSFLKSSYEKENERRELDKSFREEKQYESERRHNEFIEILKTYTSMPTAQIVSDSGETPDKTGGILETVKKMIESAVTGLKTLMAGMYSAIMAGVSVLIKNAIKVFDWIKDLKWLKNLKWLKDITSIGSFITLFAKFVPILKFLARFSGPAALLAFVYSALKYSADKLPDFSSLSPQEALNVLQAKDIGIIKKEGKSEDLKTAYDTLSDIVTQRKDIAKYLLDSFNDNPENEEIQKQIRSMGGLSKVKQIADSPRIHPNQIPLLSDIIQSSYDTIPQPLTSRRLSTEQGWMRNFGDLYDPGTAERLGFQGEAYQVPRRLYSPAPPPQSPYETTGQPSTTGLAQALDQVRGRIGGTEIDPSVMMTPMSDNASGQGLSQITIEQRDLAGKILNESPVIINDPRPASRGSRRAYSSPATTRDTTRIFERVLDRNQATRQ